MNAGIYGGVACVEFERHRKQRELLKAEYQAERGSKVCDDCPLFENNSKRLKCCGDQQPNKDLRND